MAEKLTEEQLKALLDNYIEDSYNSYHEVDGDVQKALDYYLGRPYGNEVSGKSAVTTREVAEAVDGALPQLLKIFTQSVDVVEFTPQNDGDATVAENVTAYVNHIFEKDNNGAIIMHNWFWDALVNKVGIVKAYWNTEKDTTEEEYFNLSQNELAMLMQEPSVEIVEQEEVIGEPMQVGADPMTGEPLTQLAPSTYNVRLKKTSDASKVKIENVSTDEFMIDRHADCIEDARFVAQRKMLTRAELVAMGYDKDIVAELSTDDYIGIGASGYEYDGFEYNSINQDVNNTDESQDLIAYYECYLDVGQEDGTAKKHRICYASKQILSDEEIDYVPFYSICPFPIPHQFYGQSLADRTMDLQFIKSTITRQMLDNLYLTNNSRVGAVEGQVNLDDLLNSTAGGIIRMKNPNAIVPMQVQSSAGQSFPMLEYLDQVQAKRTGVSDMNQGLDANVLQNVSATAVATMTAQSQGKLELIARIFADTGVKNLMKGLLHLVCKYQDEPRALAINGKPMNIDPREWDNQYNVNINVGLGNGTGDEKVAMLQMVLAKQEQILQQYGLANPLVTLKQYRETLAKFINASGYKDDSQFLNEIDDQKMQELMQADAQQDKTPPEVKASQAIAQAEIQKAQMKQQTDAKAQELKQQELIMKAQMEQQELALQAKEQELDASKELLKIQQERAKLEADIALHTAELQLKEQAQNDKIDSEQMKNMVNAVDKIAKING
jgi:hypothetical protein